MIWPTRGIHQQDLNTPPKPTADREHWTVITARYTHTHTHTLNTPHSFSDPKLQQCLSREQHRGGGEGFSGSLWLFSWWWVMCPFLLYLQSHLHSHENHCLRGHCYWWESVLSFKLLRPKKKKKNTHKWGWEMIYTGETRATVSTTRIQASALWSVLEGLEALYKNEWKGDSIFNKCIRKDKKTYGWSVIKSKKLTFQERWAVQRTSTQLHRKFYLDHDCKK